MKSPPVDAHDEIGTAGQEEAQGVFVVALHPAAQIVFHPTDCGKLGLVRVVLDTNILISACIKAGGLEARVVSMAATGEITACVTEEVLAEYRDVLNREKFRAWRDVSDALLESLMVRAARVVAGTKVEAAADEDDNRFLECAAAAGAIFLITGNLRHYPPEWGSTRILNARSFLELLNAIATRFSETTPQTDFRPDP